MSIKFQGTEEGDNYVGYPVEGPITSRFGVRDIAAHSSGHSGVDVAAAQGTDVVSPCNMTIDSVFWEGMDSWKKNFAEIFGNGIIGAIKDQDGDVLAYTIMGHFVEKPDLEENQDVVTGDVLGQVGSTGISTGPHLHWGITSGPNNRWCQKSKGMTSVLNYTLDKSPGTDQEPGEEPGDDYAGRINTAMAQIDGAQQMLMAVLDDIQGITED